MDPNLIPAGAGVAGFLFKKEISFGDLLTSLTILVSFIGWLITTVRKNYLDRRDEHRSGALRFLLKILREKENKIFTFDELQTEFESDSRKQERENYCGKKFKYKDKSDFEAAIYRLDWEFKIEFISTKQIKFKIDQRNNYNLLSTFKELEADKLREILKELFDKVKSGQELSYTEERTVEVLNYTLEDEVKTSLKDIINTKQGQARLTAIKLLAQISGNH